jgi:amino acid permease
MVLAAIVAVVIAQLAFTYSPWLHRLFESRPVAFADGVVIILIGLAAFVILECEKLLFRRTGLMERLGGA